MADEKQSPSLCDRFKKKGEARKLCGLHAIKTTRFSETYANVVKITI